MARPLKAQIVIVTACLVLPLAVVVAWTARLTYLQELAQLEGDASTVAATVVAYVNRGAHTARTMDVVAVQAVIAAIPMPAGSTITITDTRGVVVARSSEAERFVGRILGDARPEDAPRTGVRTGIDGVERAYGTDTAVSGQYLVSVGIPARAARDRTFPIYRRNVSWAIGVISVILIIAIIVARRWLQAVTHLESAAVRVSSGDLADPHRTPMPSREFEQLQQTFADMVARLRDARDLAAARVVEERRMREEVQLLQRQVVRQERLAAIGVLVSGIAHELNNPLQGIYGLAELLRRRDDLSAEARADVDLIERESARAAAIISNLSRFGRQQSAQPVEVALGDIVGSVMELRDRKLAEADIDVVIDNQAHQRVRAVFTELQQVLLNFVINAEQAMAGTAGARRITIRTSEVRHGVRLEVEDTGPGVAQEDESRLFQPFFSTKPVGEGTGLGLSVSYGIIHGYGGSVGYERGAAGGALFWLELPITEAQGAS